ncbi:carbohydrate porin [Rouxiella badensis]|jgi:porin|uniref:carbohydrate porin n=1 Tax=Rouxiella badensis TaxID=1646377 RepID=UPI001787F34E|nr:carbohydrate porin [Rouxiella badensis]MCC3703461.1 carbohydrate porin [Rouxiella badensis]MCC3731884.1 carbohydrate porin [Rouxiella badensis]MCC3746611.1 carbohydrate porin [Rouxiella badensis]MCC3757273.1 carbohydrate porin [Rouxiella badensis]QOI55420.1 carbohydrate porin [Rouxiella badensis subsp. acadiensis]
MKSKSLLLTALLMSIGGLVQAADGDCARFDKLLPKGPETPSIGSVCDTVFPEWGGLRQDMADNGFFAQVQLLTNLTYDVAGNWKNQPSYVGQRPTTGNVVSTNVTYDLSRIGFTDNAQLNMGVMYAYNNYRGNGQDGHVAVSELSIYQPLFNDRVILHYGYSAWLSYFYGLYLGSSTASSALGPTSVMLNQAGLTSLKPSPGFDVRLLSENKRWYDHFGVSRSQSSDGLESDSKYNTYGLRWKVPDAGTLVINEIGYRVNSEYGVPMIWVRGGSVYNKTPYFNYNSEQDEDNTWSHYLAATRQLTQPDSSLPFRGWYIDGKTNYAPQNRNVFNADASLTLFSIGPFDSRPSDMLSFGLAYNKFSDDAKRYFERHNKSAESFSTTASTAYTLRITNGIYWTNQLAWTHHPSVTPKEDDAWNLLTQIVVNL